jgi:WD40 repeat protein
MVEKENVTTAVTPATDVTAPASSAAPAFPVSRIGRFAVTGILGSGGMGVVLEARDPELDRSVAIKVLHASRDDARLQREAQAMAKVAHPNVVAVYEVGRVEDRVYLAMERVEGATLRSWMSRERSWRTIVEMFVAAGRGLVAAHDLGLVHRDFKPENVLVGTDGRPRVADFGLVMRVTRMVQAGDEPLTRSLTFEGSAVGTPAYMAPEQWLGEDVDASVDQFSFCVSLWEALHDQLPFEGTTSGELRAAVIAGRERAVADTEIPRWLDSALRRGMAREPARRWPSLRALLDELSTKLAPRSRWPWIAMAIGGVAIGATVIALAARDDDPTPTTGTSSAFVPKRNSIKRVTFGDPCEEMPAYSHDGKTIYYDAASGPDFHLFAVDAAGGTPRELTTTRGWDIAVAPSPDGKRLAFLRLAGDQPMSLFVGDTERLGDARLVAISNARPAWSPDGRHVWGGGRPTLDRFDLATGKPGRRLAVPSDHVAMFAIELTDGRVVVALHPLDNSALIDKVLLYPADDGAPITLVTGNLGEVLALHPDGASVVLSVMSSNRAVELWQQPLAPDREATLLTTGVIAARSRLAIAGRRLVWSDCREYTHLAKLRGDAFVDIARAEWSDWAPSGISTTSRVAFLSDRAGKFEILTQDLDKAGEPARFPLGDLEPVAFDVSPDGSFLAAGEGAKGLYVVPAAGAPKLLFAESGDLAPSIDRHGTTIYFERHVGAAYRIAAISTAGGEPRWVAPEGSLAPAASPTADELAYLARAAPGLGRVMVLDLASGKARALEGDAAPPIKVSLVRWSRDGKRLLVVDKNAGVRELDATTGKELRAIQTGSSQIVGATYVRDDVVIGHQTTSGDIWVAEIE